MAAGTFQKNSLDWQIQKLSQRLSEGLERLLGGTRDHPFGSQPALPEWLLRGLFGLLVIGAITWAGWQLYRLLRPYWASYWQDAGGAPTPAIATALPVYEWLQRAQRAHAEGDDREACRALYMAILQRLSERQLIPSEASRTDGEYLTLLQSLNLPPPYRVLIQTHERLWFDRVSASPAIYERCWRAYQEIERA